MGGVCVLAEKEARKPQGLPAAGDTRVPPMPMESVGPGDWAWRPLLGKLWPVCWLHVSHLLPQRRFSLILRNSVRDWKHLLCFRTATGLKQDGCSQPCQYGGGPFPSCWNCSARRGHDPEWREPGRTRTLRLLLTRGQRRGLTRPHKKGGPRKPSWAISS